MSNSIGESVSCRETGWLRIPDFGRNGTLPAYLECLIWADGLKHVIGMPKVAKALIFPPVPKELVKMHGQKMRFFAFEICLFPYKRLLLIK